MYQKICQSTLIANIKKSIFINSLERKLISTGVFVKISKSIRYSFFVRKKFLQSICIIHLTKNKKHSLYKYKEVEIKIIVINIFFQNIIIEPYQALIILDIVKNVKIKWKKCSILNQSIRGNNSFGSTGI
ncbi:dUTP diphosphatase [Blattabacterium cuenoti]|uniref:dUTP diphosphatase n=1 Tax=Blattabacterium cuenoti TaxID=1653831 RepID=UPI00163D2005|nr:dUTP diphosphatase [Blattabacterium cuenoti]